MLFSSFERTDPEPSRHSESTFQFLDRCKSVAVEKIRTEIERWLTNYPAARRDELVIRFRDDFKSPFFELLLHQLFIRQGFSVTINPDIGTRGRHPDFAIGMPDTTERVMLEATLCLDDLEADSTSPRMAPVYDAINSIDCPFCTLLISEVTFKSPGAQPSSRRIKSFLERELGKLDPEVLLASVTQPADMPCLTFEDEYVVIDFELVPMKREAWGRAGSRPIGMYPTVGRWGDGKNALRRTLNAKAKRYGQISEPFVVAVNTLSPWGSEETEWTEALFGSRQTYVKESTGEPRIRHMQGGFWGHAEAPKCTRVSAVLFGCALPFNVPRIRFLLFRNPWAARPLPSSFWRLPVADLSTGDLVKENDDISVGDILGLPADWPGDLFPDRR